MVAASLIVESIDVDVDSSPAADVWPGANNMNAVATVTTATSALLALKRWSAFFDEGTDGFLRVTSIEHIHLRNCFVVKGLIQARIQ